MVRRRRLGSPLLTDAVREVRRTLSRFVSLFILSALAVAFLSGLRTTAPDMEYTADCYFDALGLMDIRVLSTLGITEDDLAALAAVEGVQDVEGSYEADALVHGADNDLIIKLLSLSDDGFNLPDLVEGRLPQADDECLVEPAFLDQSGLSIGDTVTFDTGDGDYEDALAHDTFTIVGTANSPLYVSLVQRGTSSLGTGKVAAFVMLPSGAFAAEVYTQAYLRVEGARDLLCYETDYEDLIDRVTDALEPMGDDRAALRYDEVIGEAQAELDDAQKEFDDAEAEVNQELADAEAELADARKELDDGWQEWRDGWETLRKEEADGWQEIADGEQELADALQELEDGEQELIDARKELDDGWQEYNDGVADYEEGRAEYEDGLAEWESGAAEYEDGYQTLLDSEAEYADGLQTFQDGKAEYETGLAEYREGLQTLADNGQKLMDAKQELDDAKAQLSSGSRQLSAGQEELNEAQAQYDQFSAGYAMLSQALGASDPDSVSAALEMLTMDPTGQAAGQFHTNVVLSLRAMLDGLSQAITDGDQQAMVEQLKLALPEEETAFSAMLQSEAGRAGLAQGISGSMTFVGAALPVLADTIAQGQAQLDSARDQLADGRRQYREGLAEYEEGLAEYEDGLKEAQEAGETLAQAKAELDDGEAELRSGRKELDDGWAELDEARKELEDGRQELEDGQAELDDAWQQLTDARQELEDGEAEYADGVAQLADGRQEYEDGLAELADAKETLPREIADAEQELNDGEQELIDGEAEYADGLADYEEGKAEAEEELADARKKLNDARREISEIEDCQWYILGRDTNLGYASFQQDAQRIGNLASLFPVIFFLVAALVCLTTMTRMVEEQRVQIGAMKALGYGKGAIALKYVGYGFAASLSGGLVGLAVGCTLLPWIIFNAWRIIYTMGDLVIRIQPATYLIAVGSAVACVTCAALAAVFSTLTAVPAQLLRPKSPPIGKRVLLERIRPLWRLFTFSQKITLRNLFRYQRRFWMTVIGIGGCTALIVTAFGLRDSIFDIMERQFDEIFLYSSSVSLADHVTDDELDEIGDTLRKTGLAEDWLPIHQDSFTAQSDVNSADVTLFAVEDPEAFSRFVTLRHRLDHSPVSLPEDGAVITEKLSTLLDVSVGDTIVLDGDRRVEVTVADITENYIQHYVYLSDDVYQSLFGEAPEITALLVRYTDNSAETGDAVSSSLIPLSGVVSVSRIQEIRDTFTSSLESVDYAVVLIIICAAALAFVVLYNLTNINITERLRELATLKVLGFYDRELSAYIYRENVFLTVFGVAIGMVMGKFLHQWLVLTVEIDLLMFGRDISPMSYVWAAILTVVFSLLVNLASRRRLKKIDMVESLKTVD